MKDKGEGFVISELTTRQLNAFVKNLMRQVKVDDPIKFVNSVNQGKWILSHACRVVVGFEDSIPVLPGMIGASNIPLEFSTEDYSSLVFNNPNHLHQFPSQNKENGVVGQSIKIIYHITSCARSSAIRYLLNGNDGIKIPENWKGKNIFFWGTEYFDYEGKVYIACLQYLSNDWRVSWKCLDQEFNENDFAFVPDYEYFNNCDEVFRRSFN